MLLSGLCSTPISATANRLTLFRNIQQISLGFRGEVLVGFGWDVLAPQPFAIGSDSKLTYFEAEFLGFTDVRLVASR